MVRRQRDYRAEEARRNARARSMGYSSRAQMRRALREGVPVARGKGGRIEARAQGPVLPSWARAGFPSEAGYKSARAKSARWSTIHSQKETSRYHPQFNPSQSRAYFNAFVNPDTKASRIENELYSLREWLVDTQSYYTDEEFDERYM